MEIKEISLKGLKRVSLKAMELSKEHMKIISEFGMIPPKKMEFLDKLYTQRFEQFLVDKLTELEKNIDKYVENHKPWTEVQMNIIDSIKLLIKENFKE